MTTKTMMEENSTTTKAPHWAAEAGARLAARRAARLAEREAEAQAENGRLALPADVLTRRFADTGNLILEAADAFGRAAAVEFDADPVSAGSIQLRAGADMLTLQRQDDGILVTFRGGSRSEQVHVDLADDAFSPEATARRIAEQWFKQITVTQEAIHVDAR